jgi:hypothetical protein
MRLTAPIQKMTTAGTDLGVEDRPEVALATNSEIAALEQLPARIAL